MMKEFSDWLYATHFSHVIQTTVWMIPVIQTVHIVCLSVLFTSMAMLDLRSLGLVGTRHSAAGAISLTFWIAIVTCGRWIGFL